MLLTRKQFREDVFDRDGHKCVVCGAEGRLDAHHILERRLWPDGGYYLDNGVSVCGEHHLACERTDISVEEIREAAGITRLALPPHLYADQKYDKWGNPVLANKTRLMGELFEDESVQKVLRKHLGSFTNRVKYPRTNHLPYSRTRTSDDRVLPHYDDFEGKEVVVTLKLDGENSNLYPDFIHARSLEYAPRVDRSRLKAMHAQFSYEIPENMRICGENIWGKHSIEYDLPHLFYVFGVWERLRCLSWDDTLEWAALLDLPVVETLYRGPFDRHALRELTETVDTEVNEGIVVRVTDSFTLAEFPTHVAKWVRPNHVQTHAHWTRNIQPNPLRLK